MLKVKPAGPIGIDIGSENIKILRYKKTEQQSFVENFFILPIPAEDKSRSRQQVISSLIKETLAKNRINSKKAYVSFSSDNVFYQHDHFPSMNKEDLTEAIRWKYKDQVNFPVETAAIEFNIIRELYEDNVKHLELFIVIVSRDNINLYVNIIEEAGLTPVLITLPTYTCFEFYKQLMQPFETSDVTVWLEMGAKYSILSIFKNKTLDFSRTINFGGNNLALALNKAPENIFVHFKPSNPPANHADALYNKVPEPPADVPDISVGLNLRNIDLADDKTMVLRNEMDSLVQEVIRSLSYYKEKFGLETVEKVIISGGVANLGGIEDFLSRELKLKIEKIKLTNYIQSTFTQKIALEANSAGLVSLIGLMNMHPLTAVNLLPLEIREKQEVIQMRTPSLLTLSAAALFFLTVWNLVNGQLITANTRLMVARQQLQKLQPLANQLARQQNEQEKADQKIRFVQNILVKDLSTVRLLGEISLAIPKNIVLDEMHSSEIKTGVAGAGTLAFSIKGTISAEGIAASELADFILELKKSPIVEEITLVFLGKTDSRVVSTQHFELLCLIKS
ncbi:pilus assembly protein PilM [Candidatus Margulisiibacteriota bacterium]